ncbi:methylmalonyl-CoA mutase family protein [uncultured Hymenobacter sp.]|uniref:methylmalonyl-CoA mutase family protein n=1 Tax=uncultured Hymenobacter sp. TaxID=170016 RepID=UPI0035CAF773
MSDLPPGAAPLSFREFAPVSTAEWQARLARDLKGADPASLRWPLPDLDGLTLEPFYHREALNALGAIPTPLVRPSASFLNLPALPVPAGADGRLQIEQAADALARGADGIHFELLGDPADFAVAYLAERLPLAATFLGFTVVKSPDQLLRRLAAALPEAGGLRGFLRFAPGAVPEGAEAIHFREALRQCLRLARPYPAFRAVTVNSTFFGNRGATATQQIAFSLNTAAALLAELPDDDIAPAEVAAALHLHVGVGTSFFLEIAKLRALRQLWATLLHGFGLPVEAALSLPIYASTSSWTRTTLDPQSNLLRHTTEALGAVLGGADAVTVAPFDCLYAAPNEFSARLARNLPLLLRDEAGLGRVQDPAAGSYFIETLTDELARAAWATFQRVEAAGGLPAARGLVLEEVRKVGLATFNRIATGQQIIIGTNRFQNPHEHFDFKPKQLLRSKEFDTTRAAYPSEVLRLATAIHFERREKQNKKAALVLLGAETNRHILESFLALLPAQEQPATLPETPAGTLSLLFSSPEEATLMYATPAQFGRLARVVQGISMEEAGFVPPALLTADLATLQEAVRVFGLREFTVEGYRTEEVLARLQGR